MINKGKNAAEGNHKSQSLQLDWHHNFGSYTFTEDKYSNHCWCECLLMLLIFTQKYTAPTQLAYFCPFHSKAFLTAYGSKMLTVKLQFIANVGLGLIFNENCRQNVSVVSNNRQKPYAGLLSGKIISNIVLSLFIWEAPSHWDSTWNLARDGFNIRVKSAAAAATKIPPIHKPWKTAFHIYSSKTGTTLATKLSSFLPPCGDRIGLSLGTSSWQEGWEKLPAKAELGSVNLVKNGVWVCVLAGRPWSRPFGAWVVTTDPKPAQSQVGAVLFQPEISSSSPVGRTGARQHAGAPFAAPCAAPKKLNKDFSARAVSLISLQEYILSSLSPTSLFLLGK